jgi:hypothetical protein
VVAELDLKAEIAGSRRVRHHLGERRVRQSGTMATELSFVD